MSLGIECREDDFADIHLEVMGQIKPKPAILRTCRILGLIQVQRSRKPVEEAPQLPEEDRSGLPDVSFSKQIHVSTYVSY